VWLVALNVLLKKFCKGTNKKSFVLGGLGGGAGEDRLMRKKVWHIYNNA
jgi:hypothetical protein